MRGELAEAFGDHDQHRAGPLVDDATALGRDDGPALRFGAGGLVRLNRNTPDTTLKRTVEVAF